MLGQLDASRRDKRPFLSPQNFTLGQPVYLSPIYAAARAVAGVTRGVGDGVPAARRRNTEQYLQQGEIPLGPFQVARLDNDPSLPDHGSSR